MNPADLFPQASQDIPDGLWKSKSPIARQAGAAELWLELTERTEPPTLDKLSAAPDNAREQAFLKVAARGLGV